MMPIKSQLISCIILNIYIFTIECFAHQVLNLQYIIKATNIKLVLHACHGYEEHNNQYLDDMYSSNNNNRNEVNPFFQVGIVNIRLFEQSKSELIPIKLNKSNIESQLGKEVEMLTIQDTIRENDEKVRAIKY
jgi:hypothetical protein